MRVLVACEFSGVVRDAFLAVGHAAVSCDLLPTERPGPHIRGDVRSVLGDGWDMMIAHPPCTYLTKAGARWWHLPGRREAALAFVRLLLAAPIDRIAVENPPGAIGSAIRPADQYVEPWQFGHPERKQTGLWLVGLPPLTPTSDLRNVMADLHPKEANRTHWAAPGPERWKNRSRTLPGLAAAMAAQWGADR